MSVIETLKTITSKLSTATSSIHGEIASMRGRIKETARAIRDLGNAPIRADEFRGRVPEGVRDRGSKWIGAHGSGVFRTHLTGQIALGEYGAGRVRLPPGLDEDLVGFLCAVDEALMVRLLSELPNVIPFEAGPPSPERPALIERLEQELANLERTEEAAIDAAAEAGVAIAHRPEVLQRRQNEARARELEERALADRRRRQAALDAEAADRGGRAGRSQYLASPEEQSKARVDDKGRIV